MTTTSATSSATTSIVTALGGGSGIDMAALANNLASAQFAQRTNRLTAKSDTLDRQISAASSLKSLLLNLSTSLGDRVRSGDLSPQPQIANAAVAKGTLSGLATPSGSYSLEVTALARGQTLTSPAFTAATSLVGSGTLTLRFGTNTAGGFIEDPAHAAVPVTIAAGATLVDAAGAINSSGAGVTAYIANTTSGARLVLKGQEGAANGFVLDAAESPGDPGLAGMAFAGGTSATRLLSGASDAAFKIDGLAMTSKSNTVIEPFPGVNLSLTGTSSGAPTTITFGDPTTAVTTVMNDLTAALNELGTELNKSTDPQGGDLARDSGALAVKRALTSLAGSVIMPLAAEGTARTLSDLGLTTQRDGSFTLDTTRLKAALKSDPKAASAMFTSGLYGVFATIDGIVRSANAPGNPGSLAGSVLRYTAQKSSVTTDKTKLVAAQEKLRAQLAGRFAVADSHVGALRSTLSFLQNQFASGNRSGN